LPNSVKTVIPKALKRAEKRANLLNKASEAENNRSAKTFLKQGEQQISKSSLRRRKRKAKDEIGKDIEQGRQGGVQELKDAVQDLEMEIKDDDEEKDGGKDVKATTPLTSQSRKMTTNERRRVL
jgi:TRAP-type C4-dicarboxylate transport system substrate-binding protein